MVSKSNNMVIILETGHSPYLFHGNRINHDAIRPLQGYQVSVANLAQTDVAAQSPQL